MYCKHCGAIFDGNTNAKYCSDECRKEAYNKKQRENKAAQRKAKHDLEQAEKLKAMKRAERKAKKEAEKRQAERDKERERKIREGNPFTLMCVYPMTDVRHWRAYKDYVMGYAEKWGLECKAMVNGIPVIAPDFELLAVESVKELGRAFRTG